MNDIRRLEDEIKKNKALKNKLYTAKSLDEAVNIARKAGFKVDIGDIACSEELPESVMESVAGGKGPHVTKVSTSATAIGDNTFVDTGVNIDLRGKSS